MTLQLGGATLIPTEIRFATFREAGRGVHKGTDGEKERREREMDPSFPHLLYMWVHPWRLRGCLVQQRGLRSDGEALHGRTQREHKGSLQVNSEKQLAENQRPVQVSVSLQTLIFYHCQPHRGETELLHNKGMSQTYWQSNNILRHEL